MATEVGVAYVSLVPSAEGFGAAVNKSIQGQSGALAGGLKGTLQPVLGGLAAGAGALFAKQFFGEAFAEAEDARKAAAQTAAVLKSTGEAAGVSAKDIDTLTGSLQNKAAIDDDEIRKGANLLLTFTNIHNEVGRGNNIYDQALKAALDLSVGMGGDLQGAALQVGKALQDPINGVTALRRVGVQLTDQQAEQIKGFVEAGDAASAQKIILAELRKEFGGSAAAQASDTQRLSVAYGNLKESIGTALLPILNKLAAILIPIAKYLSEHKTLALVLAAVIGGVVVAAFTAWAISAATAAAATLIAAAPIIAIIAAIALVVAAGVLLAKNWKDVWAKIKQLVGDAVDFIKGAIGAAIGWLKQNWDIVLAILTGPIGLAVVIIRRYGDDIVEFFSGLADRVLGVVQSGFSAVTGFFQGVALSIVGFFLGIPAALANLGEGIANAIIGAFKAAWNAIRKVINDAIPDKISIPFFPDIDLPDDPLPRLHTGGVFRAPSGQAEGLALLADGEVVLTKQQAAAGGMIGAPNGRPIEATFVIGGNPPDPVRVAYESARKLRAAFTLAGV